MEAYHRVVNCFSIKLRRYHSDSICLNLPAILTPFSKKTAPAHLSSNYFVAASLIFQLMQTVLFFAMYIRIAESACLLACFENVFYIYMYMYPLQITMHPPSVQTAFQYLSVEAAKAS